MKVRTKGNFFSYAKYTQDLKFQVEGYTSEFS